MKKFADDPQHAFPGHGQMKPEQLEIARLKREVAKWRDLLTEGMSCGLHRIERLMRLQALKARPLAPDQSHRPQPATLTHRQAIQGLTTPAAECKKLSASKSPDPGRQATSSESAP